MMIIDTIGIPNQETGPIGIEASNFRNSALHISEFKNKIAIAAITSSDAPQKFNARQWCVLMQTNSGLIKCSTSGESKIHFPGLSPHQEGDLQKTPKPEFIHHVKFRE